MTLLARYEYDALGRRIIFENPVSGVTTQYYYDGQSVIEERNASGTVIRTHVHGGQYIDEHSITLPGTTGSGKSPGKEQTPPRQRPARRDEPRLTRFLTTELSTAQWFNIPAARRDFYGEPKVYIDEGMERLRAWLKGGRPVV